jgi:hypothetical protein
MEPLAIAALPAEREVGRGITAYGAVIVANPPSVEPMVCFEASIVRDSDARGVLMDRSPRA